MVKKKSNENMFSTFINSISNLSNSLSNQLKNNSYIAGLIILFLNLASKHVVIDLSENQKQFIKANVGRQIIIFTILWSGTKNLLVSFILTAIFVILADHIFNENSKYCILSKKLKSAIDVNNDGKITEKELDNAIKTIYKLKNQTKNQQASYLQR